MTLSTLNKIQPKMAQPFFFFFFFKLFLPVDTNLSHVMGDRQYYHNLKNSHFKCLQCQTLTKKKKRKCYIGHNHYIAILMIPGAFALTPWAPPLPAFRTNSTSTLLWHSLFCSRIFCFQSGEGRYDEYCALASFSWTSDTSKTPEKSNTG